MENADLRIVSRVDGETVERIAAAFASEETAILSPLELVDRVTAALDGSSSWGLSQADRSGRSTETARILVVSLLQLLQFAMRRRIDVQSLVEERRTALQTNQSAGQDVEALEEGLQVLERLLTIPAFHLAARAVDLIYDFDNLLRASRVLTDVRPLFNEDADGIDGGVVAHTLRLQFDHAGQPDEIQLSLDATDLRQLIQHCERALQKEQTAREDLLKRAKVRTTKSPD